MMLPPVGLGRARDLIAKFSGCSVLVVGDVMLDRFIVGRVSRISPEAPVPVVRFDHEYVRLGGAANVAHNLTTLGASVSLVGVLGADGAAEQVREALKEAGIASDDLVSDPARPTVEKVRLVTTRHHQVARIDYEDEREIHGEIESRLLERLEQRAQTVDVLLVSDYLKGAVTPAVMQTLLRGKRRGAPLIVDPKIPHLESYTGATLVTPNHHEAEEATLRRIRTPDDFGVVAAEFRRRARCDAALVTLGEHGMWLSTPEVEGAIPATAREVSDVTGAGDTVVATLAVSIAAGATLPEAAVLANRAAAIVIEKFGTSTINRADLLSRGDWS